MGVPVYSYLRFPCVNCSFPRYTVPMQVFEDGFPLGFYKSSPWIPPISCLGFAISYIIGFPQYFTWVSQKSHSWHSQILNKVVPLMRLPYYSLGFPPYYSNQPLEVLRESQYDILSVNIHHHFVADIFSSFCSGEIVIDIRSALIYRYIYSSSLSSVI